MRSSVQMFCCLSLLVAATEVSRLGIDMRPPNPECRVEITYDIDHYESGGRQVQVERYQPRKEGVFPVVIFVHGAAGVFARRGAVVMPEIDNFGEKQVACSGYVALLPHYLDSSGQAAVLDTDEIPRNWPLWLDAVEDTVGYVRQLPKADVRKIGLYGESLGGYLAIAVAAHDRRVRAVSEFAAGIPPGEDLRHLSPVLIQHGEEDEVVPVSEAHKIGDELKKLGVPFSLKTYRQVGHYPNRQVQSELAQETVRFFGQFLREPPARLPQH